MTPDYASLSKALVLYTYRLRSLETIAGESTSTDKQAEYNAAYSNLLAAQSYLIDTKNAQEDAKAASKDQNWNASPKSSHEDDQFPKDPAVGLMRNAATDASEVHLNALRAAIALLETAMLTIEKDMKNRKDIDGKEVDPVKFIASQQLSSKALHQVMLRFAEYKENAVESRTEASAIFKARNDLTGRHTAQIAMDKATLHESEWRTRIERVAELMADQIMVEAHERRMPPAQPAAVAPADASSNTGEDGGDLLQDDGPDDASLFDEVDAQDQAENNTGSDLDHRTLEELRLAPTIVGSTDVQGSPEKTSKAKQKANELGLGLQMGQARDRMAEDSEDQDCYRTAREDPEADGKGGEASPQEKEEPVKLIDY